MYTGSKRVNQRNRPNMSREDYEWSITPISSKILYSAIGLVAMPFFMCVAAYINIKEAKLRADMKHDRF